MRIAQVAPLWETIPPRSYGGTELVIHLLTEELLHRGHEVTLFAAGLSQTNARLEVCTEEPLREIGNRFNEQLGQAGKPLTIYPGEPAAVYYEMRLWEKVLLQADRFDIIHNHLGFFTLPFANLTKTPIVTTLHGEFKLENAHHFIEQQFLQHYAYLPFVSISDNQRIPFPSLNYAGTVYHGLDLSCYSASYNSSNKDYLAFLGRFCPDKGAHHAITIALETGWKLIMAGKVDCDEERIYFREKIEPYIDGDRICYIGELNHPQKVELLRGAAATLCPVGWREPFGLVLIESMASGTPVFALRNGSIPEIVRHGETGFIADSVEELIERIPQLGEISRRACRQHVAEHFSSRQMASNYLKIYATLIENAKKQCYPTWEERQTKTSQAKSVPVLTSRGRPHHVKQQK